MSFFSFRKRYDNIGVGTKSLGLLQRTTLPPGGSYLGPQWNIQRSMKPQSAPGFMILNNAYVLSNSLRPNTRNGMGMPGQYGSAPLAQQKDNSR